MARRAELKTSTQPDAEPLVLIRLSALEPEAIRVDGVWISPDEQGWVRASEAAELVKAGMAFEVRA